MAVDNNEQAPVSARRVAAGLDGHSRMAELLRVWIDAGYRQSMLIHVPRRHGATTLLRNAAWGDDSLCFAIDPQTGLEMLQHVQTRKKFVMGTPCGSPR